MRCWPILAIAMIGCSQWVTRDERWPPRGQWNWAVPRELPSLFQQLNGIDFGHAHLGETLLETQDPVRLEKARLEVLDFIFSNPNVPPDEEQIAPTMTRLTWEVHRAFDWAHIFHRSLYDLFATDGVEDKERVYQQLLATYLSKPEAITSHALDLHGKLWRFPESRSFSAKSPKFNTQIWAYHWLQAATYDVQLMGGADTQRELLPRLIEHYHGYLRTPPVCWEFMPMLMEGAPEFARRFPEAAIVFDNLHMLHDNVDDILSRPDLYPDRHAKREAMLRMLAIYLHRNHEPIDRHAEYHDPSASGAAMPMQGGEEHAEEHSMQMKNGGEHGEGHAMMGEMEMPGPRPPPAREVIEGNAAAPSSAAEGCDSPPLEPARKMPPASGPMDHHE